MSIACLAAFARYDAEDGYVRLGLLKSVLAAAFRPVQSKGKDKHIMSKIAKDAVHVIYVCGTKYFGRST